MRKISLFLLFLLPCVLPAQSPLSLDSCLRLAEENSVAIRRAELEIERAKQVRMQAMTKFFPQVQATALGFHALEPLVDVSLDEIADGTVRDMLLLVYGYLGSELGLPNNVSLFEHGWMAGVTAIQPVFMGGKIIAGNRLAKIGVEAAELQEQMTMRDMLLQVEESYWLVVGLQDKRRTLEHATQLLDTVEHTVRSAVGAGLALETDLMQVEVKRAELNRQHILLESGLSLARRALAQSIGAVEPICVEESVDCLASDSVPGGRESCSPEEQLLSLQTRSVELQRAMTIADALPKVAVGANYGYSQTDANILQDGLGGWNGTLFATVTVPLTGWWEAGHKIKEQSIRLEQANLEQRDLTEKLALRRQQVYDQMVVSEMLAAEAERAVALARQRAHLAEIGYEAGTTAITELLSAQSELLTAENSLTDARIGLRVARRRYHEL